MLTWWQGGCLGRALGGFGLIALAALGGLPEARPWAFWAFGRRKAVAHGARKGLGWRIGREEELSEGDESETI